MQKNNNYSQPQVLFHEEQQFRQKWLWLLILLCFLEIFIVGYLMVKQLIFGHSRGNQLLLNTEFELIIFGSLMFLIAIGIPSLLYILKLISEVHQDGILIWFYPFVRRKILFTDIKHYEARTYRPIAEYGGWGIRFGWNGTAYNVSGNRGVQLILKNGKRILIGSQKPDEFVRAIQKSSNLEFRINQSTTY
ncbi:MAG: DUF6141 family protein [bacterium]|nr:DUF6141 family protein [bacterium]